MSWHTRYEPWPLWLPAAESLDALQYGILAISGGSESCSLFSESASVLQICAEYERFKKAMPTVKVGNFFGGLPLKTQREELKAGAPSIVVGTPGRVKQVISSLSHGGSCSLDSQSCLAPHLSVFDLDFEACCAVGNREDHEPADSPTFCA